MASKASAAARRRVAEDNRIPIEVLVVSRPIHALVVRGRQPAVRRQHFRAHQHPLGVVRVQARPLLLDVVELAALVPHRVDHADAPDVVEMRGA